MPLHRKRTEMEVAGVMNGFFRVVFKISMTFFLFSVVVLLWLRPEGTSLGMMLVVIGIDAVTMILSLACLLLMPKRAQKEELRLSILEVLDRKKQEGANE